MSIADFVQPWRAKGDTRPILYEPFIRQGDSVALVGESRSGKSTAACEFIFKSICSPFPIVLDPPTSPGDPPSIRFDWDNPFPNSELLFGGALQVSRETLHGTRACILDGENDHLEWKQLLEDTARTYSIDPTSHTFNHFTDFILWRDAFQNNWNNYEQTKFYIDQTLIPDLVEAKVSLLFIDSTHKVWTRNLNDAEWVSEGLGYLRYRCRQNLITLFALTHTSRAHPDKPPQNRFLPRGTSQQENEFDCILGLERQHAEKLLKLHLVKRRAGKWCDEFTHALVALSPRHAGYTRLVESPWPYHDPRAVDLPSLTVAERNLLSKLTPEFVSLTEIPGNSTRNRKTMEGLLDLNLATKQGDPPKFKLTEKGEEALTHLK